MDCTEARRLIDRGVRPGSHAPQSAQLGFHLAECPDCRTYLERYNALLARLLLDAQEQPATPPEPTTAAQPAPPSAKPTSSRPAGLFGRATAARRSERVTLTRLLWITSVVLLVGVPIGGLLWFAGVLVRAERNISAMVVTRAPLLTPHPETATAESLLVALPPLLSTSSARSSPTETATATAAPPDNTPTALPTVPPPSPTHAPPTPEPPPAGNAVNILLLGSDLRPGETDPPRTDAIMLVRVEPHRDRIALLSLPRDLWVEIPGYGFNRINAAHVWGDVYNAPGGGLELARITVSHLLGIPVDYVALVDFEGFIGLIDTLGGVTVNVEKELYDNQFPTMDYGYTEVHFLPGPQLMDGLTALSYSRIRHPDSDFMRIRRQQAVLVGIGARLRERGDLQNVLTVDRMTGVLRDYVRTDMPQERIVGLVWGMRDFDISRVERYALGPEGVSFGVGSDAYALVPVQSVLDNLVRQFMGVPHTS